MMSASTCARSGGGQSTRGAACSGATTSRAIRAAPQPARPRPIVSWSVLQPVKEISLMELALRIGARVAAVSGVIALVVWLTWVLLDFKSMQSGFTLPY